MILLWQVLKLKTLSLVSVNGMTLHWVFSQVQPSWIGPFLVGLYVLALMLLSWLGPFRGQVLMLVPLRQREQWWSSRQNWAVLWKPLRVILIVEEDVVTWVMISSQQELKLKMLVQGEGEGDEWIPNSTAWSEKLIMIWVEILISKLQAFQPQSTSSY